MVGTMVKDRYGASPQRTSILIADDHEVARRGFRAILESEPDLHVVAEASDGCEAVEKAKAYGPCIILMDIGMPRMNGVEATRKLQKEVPESLVLIVTMHSSEELFKEAVQAGAKGYLLKSDADHELITAIRSLCRRRTYISPRFGGLQEAAAPRASVNELGELTGREREVVRLLAEGRSNAEAATLLKISIKTVETHRVSIMRKLNIHSLSELVRYAIRNLLIQP